jgi:hypothetical protein
MTHIGKTAVNLGKYWNEIEVHTRFSIEAFTPVVKITSTGVRRFTTGQIEIPLEQVDRVIALLKKAIPVLEEMKREAEENA